MSLLTRSHSDTLNATARRWGHTLALFNGSSTGAHLAGADVTLSVLAGLLQCSPTARVTVCIVSVSENGARWLMVTGTVAEWACFTCVFSMSVPRPGRWHTGKRSEYLACIDKVFADAISMESNVPYNNIHMLVNYSLYIYIIINFSQLLLSLSETDNTKAQVMNAINEQCWNDNS